ncbi:flagellar motor switch protein FliM [Nocardioides marmoriginsengisoli]|uniref:flagellar motor switch protein FliM n=1 Tax=Nocardioides marmoriginsengisoli TaxID=661483 RepID=UPI001FEA6832|nr:flagellar motor switch protein FliM [Nocardioides marmoriginsengisoli]
MSLLASAPGPNTAARSGSSGARARRRGTAEPVPYDFRRPIQLSREHSRTLQLGFDGFARQATTVFTSSLRTVCGVALTAIDQRSYAEYVDSLDASTYLTMFAADPMPGLGVLEIPLLATMSCVDHMLGGPGNPDQPQRPLTEIESGVIGGLIERLLGEMRYSLAGIVPLEPTVTGIEYSPQFAQVAGAADVMVVATFDLRIDERAHRMTVCLPFSGLLPHLATAAAPAPASDRERAKRAQAAELLQAQFATVPLEVAVRFRPTRLGPDALSVLQAGDVVRLAHPSSAPLDVTVDDKIFAHATPGAQGQRLAALIVGTQKES